MSTMTLKHNNEEGDDRGNVDYHVMAGALFTMERSDNLQNRLVAAAREGDLARLDQVLNYSHDGTLDVDQRDANGDTALIAACVAGHFKIVRRLLRHGADVTLQNSEGQIALEFGSGAVSRAIFASADSGGPHRTMRQSAWQGDARLLAKTMAENSAVNVNQPNADGFTTLQLVCRDAHIVNGVVGKLGIVTFNPSGVVQTLLLHGADERLNDRDGRTALHHAAAHKCDSSKQLVQQLTESRADLEARDNRQRTPLHYASQAGNVDVVDALLKVGADAGAAGFGGTTPLHVAAINGNELVARSLLKHGADVTKTDDSGHSPLDVAKTSRVKVALKQAWSMQRSRTQETLVTAAGVGHNRAATAGPAKKSPDASNNAAAAEKPTLPKVHSAAWLKPTLSREPLERTRDLRKSLELKGRGRRSVGSSSREMRLTSITPDTSTMDDATKEIKESPVAEKQQPPMVPTISEESTERSAAGQSSESDQKEVAKFFQTETSRSFESDTSTSPSSSFSSNASPRNAVTENQTKAAITDLPKDRKPPQTTGKEKGIVTFNVPAKTENVSKKTKIPPKKGSRPTANRKKKEPPHSVLRLDPENKTVEKAFKAGDSDAVTKELNPKPKQAVATESVKTTRSDVPVTTQPKPIAKTIRGVGKIQPQVRQLHGNNQKKEPTKEGKKVGQARPPPPAGKVQNGDGVSKADLKFTSVVNNPAPNQSKAKETAKVETKQTNEDDKVNNSESASNVAIEPLSVSKDSTSLKDKNLPQKPAVTDDEINIQIVANPPCSEVQLNEKDTQSHSSNTVTEKDVLLGDEVQTESKPLNPPVKIAPGFNNSQVKVTFSRSSVVASAQPHHSDNKTQLPSLRNVKLNNVKVDPADYEGPIVCDPFEDIRAAHAQTEAAVAKQREKESQPAASRRKSQPSKKPKSLNKPNESGKNLKRKKKVGNAVEKEKAPDEETKGSNADHGDDVTRPTSKQALISGPDWHIVTDKTSFEPSTDLEPFQYSSDDDVELSDFIKIDHSNTITNDTLPPIETVQTRSIDEVETENCSPSLQASNVRVIQVAEKCEILEAEEIEEELEFENDDAVEETENALEFSTYSNLAKISPRSIKFRLKSPKVLPSLMQNPRRRSSPNSPQTANNSSSNSSPDVKKASHSRSKSDSRMTWSRNSVHTSASLDSTIDDILNSVPKNSFKAAATPDAPADDVTVSPPKEDQPSHKPPLPSNAKSQRPTLESTERSEVRSPRFVRRIDNENSQPQRKMQESHNSVGSAFSAHDGRVVTSRLGRRRSSISTGTARSNESDLQTIQWRRGNVLGRGAYGTVWCGLTNAGELIAVKQIELEIDEEDLQKAEAEYQKIQEEVELLKTLKHVNIVGYLGTSLDDDVVSIFMQYVPGGSIASLLQRFGALDEEVFMKYTAQLLEGVNYLHANDVIHRDIKGGNIMITSDGTIKLIDFGCAKRLCLNIAAASESMGRHSNKGDAKGELARNSYSAMHGTPYWMAPEVVLEVGYGTHSDIWSVGCTVFEMATRNPPWSSMPPLAAIFSIGSPEKPVPKIGDKFSAHAQTFVALCMQRDSKLRPSAATLLNHPFILGRKNSRVCDNSEV